MNLLEVKQLLESKKEVTLLLLSPIGKSFFKETENAGLMFEEVRVNGVPGLIFKKMPEENKKVWVTQIFMAVPFEMTSEISSAVAEDLKAFLKILGEYKDIYPTLEPIIVDSCAKEMMKTFQGDRILNYYYAWLFESAPCSEEYFRRHIEALSKKIKKLKVFNNSLDKNNPGHGMKIDWIKRADVLI